MDPRARSWDGDTTINDDTNFMCIIPDGSFGAQADGKAGSVERTFFGPVYTYKGRTGRNLVLELIMKGVFSTQRDTLSKKFDTFGQSLKRFVIRDAADSNKEWYIEATPISFAKKDKVTAVVTMFVPDPIWKTVTTNSQSWTVTSSGATQAVTAGGNLEAYPTITISPQAMKSTGGGAYRRFYPIYNRSTNAGENYPVEITNGGLNTGALVADTTRTMQINQGGGISAVLTTIPYDTVVGTLPTAGMVYVDSEQISFTGRTGTTSGNLTGCTRGVNGTSATTHADNAVMYISKMEADGGDIQVLIDGEQSDYWLADMNGADTEIWTACDFSAGQSMTLGETQANSGDISTIQLQNTTPNGTAIEALPNRGYLLIGSEVFYYSAKNVTAKRFSGVKRAVLDSSMASHAIGDTIWWLEHTFELRYGIHELPSYTVDDTHKPIFNLSSSTNTSWDYDDFQETGSSDPSEEQDDGGVIWLGKARAGRWRRHTVSNMAFYYESMSTSAPSTQTTLTNRTFSVAGAWNNGAASSNGIWWMLAHPFGMTEIASADGSKFFATGSAWWTTAAMEKTNDDAALTDTTNTVSWTNVWTEAAPVANTITAWSQTSVSLSGTYKYLRMKLARTTSTADTRHEINNFTVTLDSSLTPGFGTSPGEVQVYPLNAQLKDNTTGEYITVTHTLPLADTIEIDTANKTVEHVEEGLNIRGALTKSTVRHTWLALANGANTLSYTETGVTDVDLVITWPDRNN